MPQKAIYPNGWPYCGEIDIMEHIKQENAVWQTIHSNYRNNLGNYANTSVQKACNFPDWTVYGLEWTEEYIAFFVDGVQTLKYSNMHLPDEAEKMQWPFGAGSEFYLILNMGLGARPNSWAGYVDDSGLPAIMEIDWIRVSTIDAANN